MRRPSLGLVFFCFALSLGPQGALECAPAQATIVERVVAIVNQTPILLTDLQERAKPFLMRVYASVPDGPQRSATISQVMQTILDRMIEEELEDEAAKRAGIAITSDEIDAALGRVAEQNELSVPELLKEAKSSGLSVSQYRDEMRRQLLQAKLSSLRLTGRIRVEENDVRGAYRDLVFQERTQQAQRTVRIVMPLGQTVDEQASSTALAEEIVRRARSGEDFQELVRLYGTLPGSGLAAPNPPQAEPRPIQRASIQLDVGEVSRPLRVGSTLVILQVLERPPSTLPPYEQAREAIYQRVYMERMAKARQHWLDGLRKRTHVEVRM